MTGKTMQIATTRARGDERFSGELLNAISKSHTIYEMEVVGLYKIITGGARLLLEQHGEGCVT